MNWLERAKPNLQTAAWGFAKFLADWLTFLPIVYFVAQWFSRPELTFPQWVNAHPYLAVLALFLWSLRGVFYRAGIDRRLRGLEESRRKHTQRLVNLGDVLLGHERTHRS